jgi:hypothetical protein
MEFFTKKCRSVYEAIFETTPHIKNKKFWKELIAWFSLMTPMAQKTKKKFGGYRQKCDLINFITKNHVGDTQTARRFISLLNFFSKYEK